MRIVKLSPTRRPISENAVWLSSGGTAKSPSAPVRTSAPVSSIGTSSTPAVTRARTPATAPAAASAAVSTQSSGSPNVPPAAGRWPPPPWCGPGKKTAIPIGVSSTTTSTRRYCMNATSRSSAPSSPDMPTIPDAPPAIMPSAAVGGSSGVTRVSTAPHSRLSPSVAERHERDRQPRARQRAQRVGLQVGAERDAGDGLGGAEEVRRDGQLARPRERDREPDQQRGEQVRRGQPGGVEQQAAGEDPDGDRCPDSEASHPPQAIRG